VKAFESIGDRGWALPQTTPRKGGRPVCILLENNPHRPAPARRKAGQAAVERFQSWGRSGCAAASTPVARVQSGLSSREPRALRGIVRFGADHRGTPEFGTADVRDGRFHWPESHTTPDVYRNMERSRANNGPEAGDAPDPRPHRSAPVAARQIETDDDDAGQRLDAFLARRFAAVPKSHLYRWIRSGQLRVNGSRSRIDYRLQAGDRIRIPPVFGEAGSPASATRADARNGANPVQRERANLARRLPVLFEDDDLIAIDKPASVAVHGGSGVSSGVIEQLRAARPQARFLELVHRLDRDTSGVLLVAKRRAALVSLHAQLRERDTGKRYRAIVVGRWPLRTRTLTFPLLRRDAPDGDRRVVVDRAGLEAVTHVTGIAHAQRAGEAGLSLVEARLETGRTHQIRVHLAHAGCPIAGDHKYGDFELNRRLARGGHRRMYLHAQSIAFRHPRTGERMRIEAPTPPAFEQLLGVVSAGRDEAPT